MKNFIQSGNLLTVPSPAAVASGDVLVIGGFHGVAAGDAVEDELVDVSLTGVFRLPKVAADAFAIGDAVYFASATKLVTSTAAGNTFIGNATEVAAASTGTVAVRLSN